MVPTRQAAAGQGGLLKVITQPCVPALIAGLLAAALLGACGGGGSTQSQATPGQATASQGAGSARRAGAGEDTEFVAAFTTAPNQAPVELHFALRERPQVGQPVELALAVRPISPLNYILATVQADDGLVLVADEQSRRFERPKPGVVVPHSVRVVPQREGIFRVTVTLLAEAEQESIARTFVIPVIATAAEQPEDEHAGS
jgi:hypothetical protein